MRTLAKNILVLFLLSSLLGGCLGEGDLDCTVRGNEQQLTLKFLHNINPDYTNNISEVLEYIDLYLYQESGDLLSVTHLTKEELEATDYTYTTRMQPGNYRLATWMNAGEDYVIENSENISQAQLRVLCDGNNHLDENTPGIYYGYDDKLYDYVYENQDVVFTIDWYPVEKNINFAKNTNQIEIISKFDRVLPNGLSDLNVYIAGANGSCNFNNRGISTCPLYTYHPHQMDEYYNSTDPIYGAKYYQSYQTNITTQRLWQGDDLELIISYTDLTGYEDELARFKLTDELIMRNPLYNNNFQLERYEHYRIVFYFDYERSWTITEITVNDWKLVSQNEEIGPR